MTDEVSAVSTSTPVESNTESTVVNETEIQEIEQTLAQNEPKKYKVKWEGQEQEATEEELIANYQAMKASQKRFNDASRMTKQAEEFVKLLKTDPKKALTHPAINADLKALARDWMAEMMEEELLSPEQKELKTTKQRLAELETARRQQEDAHRNAEMEKYTKVYENQYTGQFIEALDTYGLPKNEKTISMMAGKMLQALKAGYDVTPKDVAEFVKQDYEESFRSMFSAADEDTLLRLLGDQTANKVVKGHLNKMKKSKTIPPMTEITVPKTNSERHEPKKAFGIDEWRAKIRK